MTNPTLLIIDDEETVIMIAKAILEEHQYTVYTANNGAEGLNIIENTPIDGVILDIKMPGMDGNEVLSEIRKNPKTKTLPVLMLTGENSSKIAMKTMELGANDYMIKPFDRDSLGNRVRNLLEINTAKKGSEANSSGSNGFFQKLLSALKLRG